MLLNFMLAVIFKRIKISTLTLKRCKLTELYEVLEKKLYSTIDSWS